MKLYYYTGSAQQAVLSRKRLLLKVKKLYCTCMKKGVPILSWIWGERRAKREPLLGKRKEETENSCTIHLVTACRAEIYLHVRNLHLDNIGTEKLKCSRCDYSALQRGALVNHIKSCHPTSDQEYLKCILAHHKIFDLEKSMVFFTQKSVWKITGPAEGKNVWGGAALIYSQKLNH